MGKLIITENQYNKLKDLIIEGAINESLLNEQIDNFSYTVHSGKVSFENVENSNLPELQIYKGAKFVSDGKGNLITTTKFNFGDTQSGDIAYSPDSAVGFVDSDEDIPRYTYQDKVIYSCKKGKFTAPSRSKYQYFAEDSPAPELVGELGKLCQRAKSQKDPSKGFGAEAVGGGSGYTQKYDQNVKNDKGEVIKIPKNTGYVSKNGGTGASFRVGNQYGWFDCKAKNFIINKVRYANSVLADHIGKSLCQGTVTPTPSVGGGGSPSVGGSKVGGWKPNAQTLTDIEMYI